MSLDSSRSGVAARSALTSGDLQVSRWVRRNQELLEFLWTPGRDPIPGDGLISIEHFEDQPKLGPAVLYDRPIESSYTTSVEQFRRNTASGVVRLVAPKNERRHDETWFRRSQLEPGELDEILTKIQAEPPPGTFFDEHWTRAQLEERKWFSVHGLVRVDDDLREVIVLCSCHDDPPSVSARRVLAEVQTELRYDFVAAEVYRIRDVGPAVSGLGVLRIERGLR